MDSREKQILGMHIQACREAAHLTQQELGDRVGISSTSISKIERGITVPTMDNLIRILNILNVPADTIFYDIVHSSSPIQPSILEQKLQDLSAEERKQIMLVMEMLMNNS